MAVIQVARRSKLIYIIGLTGLLLLCVAILSRSARNEPTVKAGYNNFIGEALVPTAKHLVIVTGHAIWKGSNGDIATVGEDEDEWFLKPFQKNQQQTFIKHIKTGIDIAEKDRDALIVFSGGQTNLEAGPIGEGQSYWSLANRKYFLTTAKDLVLRATTEDYAKDSYENLLFSICRFNEYVGDYPKKITVIGHKFKQERFENLHRAAIQFPFENFHYVGIDPPGGPPLKDERLNALLPFSSDPYGCFNTTLTEKKTQRNPFRRNHPYIETCPELSGLFTYCSKERKLYSYKLPWSR
ncbi:hypothetical protein V1511DRAFT_103259 [Dipodascopsis uninucleata]